MCKLTKRFFDIFVIYYGCLPFLFRQVLLGEWLQISSRVHQTCAGQYTSMEGTIWFVTINLCPGESGHSAEISHNISKKEIVECAAQIELVVTNKLARLQAQEDDHILHHHLLLKYLSDIAIIIPQHSR